MAEARPMVTVFAEDGSTSGEVQLPGVFSSPIRPDLVNFVHTQIAKNKRQAYAVSNDAGMQHSAQSWGTGRAVSRIPRVQGGGTSASGQGAFGNMCRGGRMFAPNKTWRKWNRKINLNQRRYAVASALAASAVPPLVMARGHKIDEVPEMPLVVGGGFEAIAKTSEVVKALAAIGCDADVEKCKASKKIRCGVGKTRNRRYTMRRGPLIVYDGEEGIKQAARNLPGVDLTSVDRLNLLQLAPGGHMGRFCIWSEAAFNKLDTIFGDGTSAAVSKTKKGNAYFLPKSQMKNADLARIINSDEVQSVINPAKEGAMVKKVKINPLRSAKEMEKLNPYVTLHRKSEQKAQEARKAARAKTVASKRTKAAAAVAFIDKAAVEGELLW